MHILVSSGKINLIERKSRAKEMINRDPIKVTHNDLSLKTNDELDDLMAKWSGIDCGASFTVCLCRLCVVPIAYAVAGDAIVVAIILKPYILTRITMIVVLLLLSSPVTVDESGTAMRRHLYW